MASQDTWKIPDLAATVDQTMLVGKDVLITGGASGIGAMMALRFADYGASVTMADINKAQGGKLEKELTSRGKKAKFVFADVCSWESQVQMFKEAIELSEDKTVDIVITAAGVAGSAFIQVDEAPASLERDPPLPPMASAAFDVNAKGVYYTAKLAQHYFGLSSHSADPNRAVGFRKTLILVSSLAGYLELNNADYTATKWAVRGLFRSIRTVMEDKGYRTNLLAPWVMDTPMSHEFAKDCRAAGVAVGNMSDVVDAALRCAVDDTICGRAFGIGAQETFDLEDDLRGLNSGHVMSHYLEGEAKALMTMQGQRP